MNKFYLFIFFLLAIFEFNSQDSLQFEIPKLKEKDTVIHHFAYAVSYNSKHRQANWIAYQFIENETNNLFERENSFKQDPKIQNTDNAIDYKASGFDRGHLAPAGDMGFSEIAMKESFFYSNVSPQLPGFNRGIWKSLENLVRDWAVLYDTIYVVTGPILSDNLLKIGPHQISIPELYFKVIYTHFENKPKAIAFIMKNEKSENGLKYFATSIDVVEEFTDLDFFPLLPDSLENEIESVCELENWIWN